MAALNKLAKISSLKGKAYRFKHNHFYLLKEQDTVSVEDIILTDYQAVMVLDFSTNRIENIKYLVPEDSLIVLRHAKSNGGFIIDALLNRIERLIPTVNGEASSVRGVYSLVVDDNGYQVSLVKSLSLAQVSALQQLAKLSSQFSFDTQDEFHENQLLDAIKAKGINAHKLVSIQQPLKGKIIQKRSSTLCYLPVDYNWQQDFFSCLVLDDHQAPVSVTIKLSKDKYDMLALKILINTPVSYLNWVDDVELMGVMGGTPHATLQDETMAQAGANDAGDNDSLVEEDDNEWNVLDPTFGQVVHEIVLNQADNIDEHFYVIDNFSPQDSIALTGLDVDFEELTNYLRVSLRESEHNISTLIEVSHEGQMTDNRVTQTLVIDQVDLVRDAANQDDIINQLINSGTLSLDFNNRAA